MYIIYDCYNVSINLLLNDNSISHRQILTSPENSQELLTLKVTPSTIIILFTVIDLELQ